MTRFQGEGLKTHRVRNDHRPTTNHSKGEGYNNSPATRCSLTSREGGLMFLKNLNTRTRLTITQKVSWTRRKRQ